ncbi:MAG: hypothetical protein AB7H92_07390 [Microbacteriaceae bacterium]
MEYLHLMAYTDSDAQEAHWKAEEVWWWDALSAYIDDRPILAERFQESDVIFQHVGSTAGRDAPGLSVSLITLPSGTDLTQRAGDQMPCVWAVRRAATDAGLFPSAGGEQVVVVSTERFDSSASSDDLLRGVTTVPDGALVEQFSLAPLPPIACLVRTPGTGTIKDRRPSK